MGCHTHYLKLVTNNQEEIVKRVRDTITKSNNYYWFEFKELNELFNSDNEFIIEIADWVFECVDGLFKVNDIWGIYEDADGFCIDAPRIGNYPDIIITSADEMFKSMKDGLIGYEGIHSNFYWDKENEDNIKNNIIEFFNKYPDGIIQFG